MMLTVQLPIPTFTCNRRVVALVMCLFIALAPFAGAQPAQKDDKGKGFGSLAHGASRQQTLSLLQLPKKWHRNLKRRIQGLTDESQEVRKTSLDKLLGIVVHQKRLAKGMRALREKGPGPAEVVQFIEVQIVSELQRTRGAWGLSSLLETVLDAGGKDSLRLVALDLLVQAQHGDASTLLLVLANRGERVMRNAALTAMAHWPREELDMHLCQGLVNNPDNAAWRKLVAHRVGSHGPLNKRAGAKLIPVLRKMVVSEDWKTAGQALWIAKGLSKERHVEFLVTSIASVAQAVKSGTVRWRILSDIGAELREISGRSMGLEPRPWQAWYERVKSGEIKMHVDEEDEPRTNAKFFGIGSVSDHVTFVIDGSGSMKAPWATGNNDFYEEAVRQMVVYLSSMGEGTYFRVVLFATDAKVMVPLQKVERGTLDAVKKTMLRRAPDGGTALGAGIELALKHNAADERKAREGASDAFIVLCDGLTREGANWAHNLIARDDFPLGLRFHCVQLGGEPAAAMEALAKGTGGRFVRVKP